MVPKICHDIPAQPSGEQLQRSPGHSPTRPEAFPVNTSPSRIYPRSTVTPRCLVWRWMMRSWRRRRWRAPPAANARRSSPRRPDQPGVLLHDQRHHHLIGQAGADAPMTVHPVDIGASASPATVGALPPDAVQFALDPTLGVGPSPYRTMASKFCSSTQQAFSIGFGSSMTIVTTTYRYKRPPKKR